MTYGSVLTSRNTVSSAAKTLESQGYRVVAGINGDFYNVGNGLPIGIVITEGQLRSTDGGYHAIGFRADGTAVIGKPTVKVSADLGYQALDSYGVPTQVVRQLTGVNKARVSTGGIYLYTYDFNTAHTTGTTEAGVDVLCTIVDGQLGIGDTLTVVVDQVLETSTATPIGPDQVVLSANQQSNTYYTDAAAATFRWAPPLRSRPQPPARSGTMWSTRWVRCTPWWKTDLWFPVCPAGSIPVPLWARRPTAPWCFIPLTAGVPAIPSVRP